MSSLPQNNSIEQGTILAAALEYNQRGLAVIPIKRADKTALVGWRGFQLSRPTDDQILEWFAEYPGANLAIITGSVSGIVVLDIDSPEGLRIAKANGLPKTPAVKTGKGWHLYFKHPGAKLPNWVKKIQDIDLRGDGGYVVAPPSIHENGAIYSWVPDTADLPFADLPSWVIDLAHPPRPEPAFQQEATLITRPRAYAEAALASASSRVANAQQGTRNDTLFRETSDLGKLLGGNFPIDRATIEREMFNAALSAGLTQDEAFKTIASALEHGLTQPRTIEDIPPAPPRPNGSKPGAPPPSPAKTTEGLGDEINNTDTGNARRMAAIFGDEIRFVNESSSWLIWTGNRWEDDRKARIHQYAWHTVAAIYREAADLIDSGEKELGTALTSWGKQCENRARLDNMVTLASRLPGIRITTTELNRAEHLLNCQNGTINLHTGELQEHRKDDLLTKIIPAHYDPDAQCPLWIKFLTRIMDDRTHIVDFLQRAIGYTLTASVQEQCLFFLFGNGKNGKSTFIETLSALLGDYMLKLPTESLMSRPTGSVRNDLATLPGARLVVAAETEEGRRLDEALVKDLTGGDQMTARFLHHEFFKFSPTHKLWMYGNHEPLIRGSDEGIWRRMLKIPFNVQIQPNERDPQLTNKLRQELPGILNWAVQGCMIWQQQGLGPIPLEVQAATAAYRAGQDVMAAWLEECVVRVDTATTPAAKVYESFSTWCKENGEHAQNQRVLGQALTSRGFERTKWNGRVVYKGLGLVNFGDGE